MRLDVPEEDLCHARHGKRLPPQALTNAIQRTWPHLWNLCASLAREQKEARARVYRDISHVTGIHHLQILHGMAGTAVRRELSRHFGCRFSMTDQDTVMAMVTGDSEPPASTRVITIIERDLPLGVARLALLAEQARESPDGFASDGNGTISDKELFQLLRLHAVEPYRHVLEMIFGAQLAFHGPHVSAARRRGKPSVLFEAFTSIEEAILRSAVPSPRD